MFPVLYLGSRQHTKYAASCSRIYTGWLKMLSEHRYNNMMALPITTSQPFNASLALQCGYLTDGAYNGQPQ